MKIRNSKSGFTLIELLVVIAIIAILAATILVALGTARKKAKDARVISDVQQIRTQIESDSNGSNYNGSFSAADTLLTTGTYKQLTDDADAQSAVTGDINVKTTIVSSNYTAYAIYGKLVTNTGLYFCVDSTGKTNPSAPANTTVLCP